MNRSSFLRLVLPTLVWSPAHTAGGSGPLTVRLLAYNIHHGEGEDGKLDLPRIAGVIKNCGADIVLLQEVDDRTTRTGKVPQADELGRLTGLHPAFGKAMDFAGGGYGNAALSRFPVKTSRVIPLPGGKEDRCALEVALEVGPKALPLTVVSTHLDVSVADARKTHAALLAREFAARPEHVIIGGDFNSTRSDPPLAQFTAPWRVAPKTHGDPNTIPSGTPDREIDFFILKPTGHGPPPQVVRHEVLDEKVASDHRPILMEVAFPAP